MRRRVSRPVSTAPGVGMGSGMGIVAAVLTLVVSLAGCATPAPGNGQLPAADDPVAWAGRLCASLQPLGALKGQLPAMDPNDPSTGRATLSTYFTSAEQAADQALTGLAGAGSSPIAGGDDAVAALSGALHRLRDAYHEAKTKIDAIDPKDPVGLGTQLPGIFSSLAAASNDAALNTLGTNAGLNDAVKKAASCSLMSRSAGAGG
jgi:hypothetical protein